MEYVQDKGFRERLGAVTNRTYRSWRTAKLTHKVRFVTAPVGVNLRKEPVCPRAIHCASYIERKEAQ